MLTLGVQQTDRHTIPKKLNGLFGVTLRTYRR
jgi:hypothetical protein